MNPAMLWWIAAIVLSAAELLTGTLYLLVIASGAVAGALAAHMGWSLNTQMILAAVVGVVDVTVWHIWRLKKQRSMPASFEHNATLNELDIGETVMVKGWQDDGSTNVLYRGAIWSAVPADSLGPTHEGRYVVVGIRRNQLVLQPEQ